MENEINYNEVFGIETGANEQEPAQPATDTTDAVKSETAVTEEGANEAEPADQPVDKQSSEENAKFAAARRKAEQERDAAVAQARADAQRSVDETIKSLGLTNSYTGQPINTKAEYDEWKRKEAEAKKAEVAEASGMNEQEFNGFVENLPQVQVYKRIADAARKEHQRTVLEEQIAQISKLDPSVKTVEDLTNREDYKAIYAKVQQGNSIVDAFKLVNFEKLTQSAAGAARQAAINSTKSKEHLTATTARGAGSVSVPADVKALYRNLNPDMTDAQIQEHYNRFHKN